MPLTPRTAGGERGVRVLLGLLGAVGALILLSQSAAATHGAPAPPPTLVVEVLTTQSYVTPGIGENWQATVALNFRWSPDDPDQTSGAWQYFVWINGVDPISPDTDAALAGRPGWGTINLGTLGGSGGTSVWTFSVAVNDTTPGQLDAETMSCEVTVDLRAIGFNEPASHAQCGEPVIGAPPGFSVVVTDAIGESQTGAMQSGSVELRWRLSEDDPNQLNGSFEYMLFQGLDPELPLVEGFLTLDPFGAGDGSGIRFYDFDYQGTAPSQFQYAVKARDNVTRQRSDFSCVLVVDDGVIFDQYACGTLGVPGVGIAPGTPTFPLVDVPQAATDLGLSQDALGLGLGAGLVLVAGVGGVVFAGVIGGITGTTLGAVVGTALGLIPLWGLAVAFLAAVGVIVLILTRGGGA